MKHCPTCGSSYTDDTLVYCLQDGATLQEANSSQNPLNLMATLRGGAAEGDDAPAEGTKFFSAPTVEIPGTSPLTAVQQEPRLTQHAGVEHHDGAAPAAAPSKLARTVLITVIATVLLLAVGSITAWVMFRGRGDGRGRERRAEENSANAETGGANTSNAEAYGNTRGADRPDKGGRWFVILGSYPKAERSSADERAERIRRQGFDARVVASDEYPNLEGGLWLIVMGPYTRNNAQEVLEKVKPKIKDAYTKSGW
jgi:hypothetical protein